MAHDAVLLVEDSPDDVDLTLRAFRTIGFPFRVVVARDGVEALDYLFGTGAYAGRDRTDTPVVVILDLKLPKIDGLEVLRKMRADPLLRSLVVVILTTSDDDHDSTEALKLGSNLYFRKALDFDEFLAIARRIASLMPSPR